MMGRVHADGWAARPDARVAAVYDPIEDRCRELAAHTGARAGCTVAPGFDFADFELADREALCRAFPGHRRLISRLTPPSRHLAQGRVAHAVNRLSADALTGRPIGRPQ
jgi:predicted dehydrogenase